VSGDGGFDIRFIGDVPESLEEFLGEGAMGLRGRITLGDYAEEFMALLGPWAREDYERHWREAALRLARGADRTAFFTSAFEFRWTLWRVGDHVFAREHSLEADGFPEPFDPANLYAHIQDRTAAPVSEWRLDFGAVAAFAARARHPST
jgi:hypothetical protein